MIGKNNLWFLRGLTIDDIMLDPQHPFFIAVTDLGDSAVLGGVTLLTGMTLAATGSRRAAALLVLAFLAAAAAMGLLKILFYDCGFRFMALDIRSPSGHAALAVVVWGMLAAITARQLAGWRKYLPVLVAASLTGLIAVTRVTLGFHTLDEVCIGLLAGMAVMTGSILLLRRAAPHRVNLRGVMLAAAAAILMLHGLRLPAENFIRLLGEQIRSHVPACGGIKHAMQAVEKSFPSGRERIMK